MSRRILLVGIGIAALTSIPYLVALASEGEAWVFTGFVFGVEDGNSYLAKMLYGNAGGWLFRSPYSAAPQSGVVAFLPYILLGKLARQQGAHTQLVLLFHLFRVGSILLMAWATYRFVARYLEGAGSRTWGTLLALVGGGLGWLLIAVGQPNWLGTPPLDFYSPESFGFLAAFGIPHLAVARALLLLGLLAYLDSYEIKHRGWLASALLIVLGLIHPVAMVTFAAVVIFHSAFSILVRRERIGRESLAPPARTLLPAAPLYLYFGFSFMADPYLRQWTAQNVIPSPHPVHYLLAYGLLVIPAVRGASSLLRPASRESLLPVAWVLLLPVMAYAPHNLQRRLPEGVWVALVTLALLGLSRRWRPALGAPLLISPLLILASAIQFARHPGAPMFRSREEIAVFLELESRANPGDVVLSSFDLGNALPAWAPVSVVIGHGPETVGLHRLEPEVESFYSGSMSAGQARAFLAEHRVSWVLHGPVERSWGPARDDVVELVYEEGRYQILAPLP